MSSSIAAYQTGRKQEWNPWKHLIRRWYIAEDKKLEEVREELSNLGFQVKPQQLEYQLKKWGFFKNLKSEVWRYVGNTIESRAAEFKETMVILSGRRLPAERVTKETRPYPSLALAPVSAPPPPEGFPLYLCTPRASTTDVTYQEPWPDSLPWLQFCRSHLGIILENIDFAPTPRNPSKAAIGASDAPVSLSELARKGPMALTKPQKSETLQVAFQQMARISLGIVMGCEKTAIQYLGRTSIDSIAARFDVIFPETYTGENLQRAATLVGGSPLDLQIELLQMIFYIVSNNLLFRDDKSHCDNSPLFVTLCRLSGLSSPHRIRNLVQLSRSSYTLTAVVETLFKAAVNAQAVDIVRMLLDADDRIDPNQAVASLKLARAGWYTMRTPLVCAAYHGLVDLAIVLLKAGAKVDFPGTRDDTPPLSVAIFASNTLQSDDMVKLLLQWNANVNGGRGCLSPLHAAIIIGNIALVDLLIAKGADLSSKPSLWFDLESPICLSSRYGLDPHHQILDIDCLAFAVSFSSISPFIDCSTTPPIDLSENDSTSQCVKDERRALQLCEHILDKYDARMDLEHPTGEAAMVLAALRGYSEVVRFLHHRLGVSLDFVHDSIQGSFSPLYAAIVCDRVDTCRTLLRLGVSPDANLRIRMASRDFKRVLAPLHIAIVRHSYQSVEVLIQYGANVDALCDIYKESDDVWIGWDPWDLQFGSMTSDKIITVTPLRLAILLGREDIALLLLRSEATATGEDLVVAARHGNFRLVEQLVLTGIHPDEAFDGGVSALHAALSQGHWSVANHLVTNGATATVTASIWRLPSLVQIRTAIPQQLFGDPIRLSRDADGRGYLENAFLSGDEDVISYALSADKTSYDSGALCAAVFKFARSLLPSGQNVIEELIQRRSRPPSGPLMDSILENTAISIAAWHGCLEAVLLLLRNQHAALDLRFAVIPVAQHDPNSDRLPHYHPEFALNVEMMDETAIYWHTSHYRVSPLLFAIQAPGQNKELQERIIHLLLDAGYRVDGFTLSAAISRSFPSKLVKALAIQCDDINAECVSGLQEQTDTPLFLAIKQGSIEAVETLLGRGADINLVRKRNGSGRTIFGYGGDRTALLVAVRDGRLSMVQYLLSRGADPNNPGWSPTTYRDSTALNAAIYNGHIGIVKCLVAGGADVNARRGIRGATPLEKAAKYGRLEITSLLLSSQARTETSWRAQYVRATWLATRGGHRAVAEILRSHRLWTAEDETLWQMIERYPRGDQFLCPEEISQNELVELIAECPSFDLPGIACLRQGREGCIRAERWHDEVAKEILIQASAVVASDPTLDKASVLDDAIRAITEALEKHDPVGSSGWYDHGEDIEPDAHELASRALKQWASAFAEHPDTTSDDIDAPPEDKYPDVEDMDMDAWDIDAGLGAEDAAMNTFEATEINLFNNTTQGQMSTYGIGDMDMDAWGIDAGHGAEDVAMNIFEVTEINLFDDTTRDQMSIYGTVLCGSDTGNFQQNSEEGNEEYTKAARRDILGIEEAPPRDGTWEL